MPFRTPTPEKSLLSGPIEYSDGRGFGPKTIESLRELALQRAGATTLPSVGSLPGAHDGEESCRLGAVTLLVEDHRPVCETEQPESLTDEFGG